MIRHGLGKQEAMQQDVVHECEANSRAEACDSSRWSRHCFKQFRSSILIWFTPLDPRQNDDFTAIKVEGQGCSESLEALLKRI